MTQQIAWGITLVLMTLVALAFIYVAIHSGAREDDYASAQKRAYRLRKVLFWVLVAVLMPAMIYTLFDLPYGAGASERGISAHVIEAKGHQWRWELSRDRVVAGESIEFRVTSTDVNHGFGIYDPDMRLVAQAQAMPGVVNKLRYTFTRGGTYRILCMEYCGTAHHNMITEISVGPR